MLSKMTDLVKSKALITVFLMRFEAIEAVLREFELFIYLNCFLFSLLLGTVNSVIYTGKKITQFYLVFLLFIANNIYAIKFYK